MERRKDEQKGKQTVQEKEKEVNKMRGTIHGLYLSS
jgi:hypothetical protein